MLENVTVMDGKAPEGVLEEPGVVNIGIHGNKFHLDDALACGLTLKIPKFQLQDKKVNIIRMQHNDLSAAEKCQIVADIGGIFDIDSLRFDHHQSTFKETFSAERKVTTLSSAGIIYRTFGKDIVRQRMIDLNKPEKDDECTVDSVYKQLYTSFVEAVDAEDNGVPRYDGAAKFEEGTSLGSRVSYLNPMWNHPEQELERPMRFKKAMIMAITEFYDCLDNLLDGWVVARRMTKKMMEDRLVLEQLKPFQGKVVYQTEYFPWPSHLIELEKEMGIKGEILLLVGPSSTPGEFRVQTIGIEGLVFSQRISPPKEWGGLRGKELEAVCGIEGASFCHKGLFLMCATTIDAAFKMAYAILKFNNKIVVV